MYMSIPNSLTIPSVHPSLLVTMSSFSKLERHIILGDTQKPKRHTRSLVLASSAQEQNELASFSCSNNRATDRAQHVRCVNISNQERSLKYIGLITMDYLCLFQANIQ